MPCHGTGSLTDTGRITPCPYPAVAEEDDGAGAHAGDQSSEVDRGNTAASTPVAAGM